MTEEGNREEEKLAKLYEEHAGDLSLWETKPRKIRIRRGGPSHTFSVRFAPEEMELLQSAADERGVTISELIREAALSAAKDERAATVEEVRRKTRDLARTVGRL